MTRAEFTEKIAVVVAAATRDHVNNYEKCTCDRGDDVGSPCWHQLSNQEQQDQRAEHVAGAVVAALPASTWGAET